jgi:hypothetical protein
MLGRHLMVSASGERFLFRIRLARREDTGGS